MRLMRDGDEMTAGQVIGEGGETVMRLVSLHPDRDRVIVDYESPWGVATRECLAAAIGAEFVADEDEP
ncbi:MAG: hypothetical protein AB7E55_25305 [Pigmentiphaga sp.]